MTGDQPGPERRGREALIQAEMDKILKEWKNSQVYLASTSGYRRRGLEDVGFKKENIHACPVPDEVEQKAFDDYQQTFVPSIYDPRGSYYPVEISSAKLRALQIPDDAFGVALDTLPMTYEKNPKYGEDNMEKLWLAKASPKPESTEKARQVALENFLLIARNYLRAMKLTEKMTQGEEASEDLKEGLKWSQFNCNIKVKTSIAIKFPHRETILPHSTEVQLRPQKIYDLVKKIDLEGMDEDYILDKLEPNELADKKVDGKTVRQCLEELIDELVGLMQQEGTDVTKISGGVNYGSEKVREFLKIEEISHYDSVEQGVYLGFPKDFFDVVLRGAAELLADRNVSTKFPRN